MVMLDVHKVPDPILRVECYSLDRVTSSDKELFENMEYTMFESGGIGLAASQVGIEKRMIVAFNERGRVFKIANPVIVKSWGSDTAAERCLSIPDQIVEVRRNYRIVVEGVDENNKALKLKVKGIFARVLQHEVDHLRGRLITDYRR
ncbi:MAG: peptide deformylase [Candidatus Kaelpia aquatica]|nr:peptide deformylase [Candidatus Kaelpia aquatica]